MWEKTCKQLLSSKAGKLSLKLKPFNNILVPVQLSYLACLVKSLELSLCWYDSNIYSNCMDILCPSTVWFPMISLVRSRLFGIFCSTHAKYWPEACNHFGKIIRQVLKAQSVIKCKQKVNNENLQSLPTDWQQLNL